MKNVEITVEVDGKEVPLETISTETFEKIKAAAKESDLDRAIREYGIDYISFSSQYKLGTRLVLSNGWIFKYVKIDYGIVGYNFDKSEIRHIEYRWIRVVL